MMLSVDDSSDKTSSSTTILNEESPPTQIVIEAPATLGWVKQKTSMANRVQSRYPWIGWAFVYVVMLFVFSIYRCAALGPLIKMYATDKDVTTDVVIGALILGFLEDFVCTTYFACTLWLFDAPLKPRINLFCSNLSNTAIARVITKFTTFTVSWLLFVAIMTPFVADVVIVRLRDMRFTFDLVAMAIEEKDHADAVAVSSSQMTEAILNVIALVIVATFFAVVRTWIPWTDLSRWNPTQIQLCVDSGALSTYCSLSLTEHQLTNSTTEDFTDNANNVQESDGPNEDVDLLNTHKYSPKQQIDSSHCKTSRYTMVAIDEDREMSVLETKLEDDEDDDVCIDSSTTSGDTYRISTCCERSIIVVIGLVFIPIFVVAVSCASSPLIACTALNTTLNELLGHVLQPSVYEFTSDTEDTNQPWIETFIDKTEEHELFGNDTLYRRTIGFHGDLAFNVSISDKDPPNVLVIVIESFRYHDSHYLVGEEDPSNLFKGSNITITPNFDKWAKRGIALRNYWSSWRTSRSVESLMFGQLPYDSVTKSGMTGGQRNTKLSGLPQLFTAKGYETFFTTGCLTDYDNWDTFLPAHGFDTVWSRDEMKKLAESDLGIKHNDWDGPEHRGLNWGVHDDVSFQLLGDLLVNKTKAQVNRVAKGEAKKPLFLNHYTISSHVDYKQRPKWYDRAEKPDFSALYEGQEYSHNIKNYLEMRYFTDMELGKFMDRMDRAGILNDTIVVITGDHGQGPEFGNDVPEDRDVSATRVGGAIVAEGRLGNAVGMIIDDATEQYDILNTLADITGVPEGGFEQDGVGRSLRRKITFGERVVYSNNPTRKMSVVRGHLRLRYDKVTGSKLLHNADTDHDMKTDLFPELSVEEKSEWLKWRDAGRLINSYYTERWEGKCLVRVDC